MAIDTNEIRASQVIVNGWGGIQASQATLDDTYIKYGNIEYLSINDELMAPKASVNVIAAHDIQASLSTIENLNVEYNANIRSCTADQVVTNVVSVNNIESNIAWDYPDPSSIVGLIGATKRITLGSDNMDHQEADHNGIGIAIGEPDPGPHGNEKLILQVDHKLTEHVPPVVIVRNAARDGSVELRGNPIGGEQWDSVGLVVLQQCTHVAEPSTVPALCILANQQQVKFNENVFGFYIGQNMSFAPSRALLLQPSTDLNNNAYLKAPDIEDLSLELLGNFKLGTNCNIYDKDGTPIVLNGKKV